MRRLQMSLAIWLLMLAPAHAGIFFDDSFEAATVDASGWGWNGARCEWAPTQYPCPFLDISTDIAHSGSKSLKGTYNAAWSDPNEQINKQGIFKSFPATTNLYTRYWYRTAGFTYSSPNTKTIYYKGGPGYPNGVTGHAWGQRTISIAVQVSADCGYSACAFFYSNMASRPLADNVWYCIEEHWKLNDIGQANGMVEIWVDGTQVLGTYNRTFRGTAVNGPGGNSSNMQFNNIEIYKQNGHGLMYYDQVAAGTPPFANGSSRIGCGSSVPPPPPPPPPPTEPDTIPPAVVTGTAAAVAGTGVATITWNATTDTGGSGLAGYNLYQCAGAGCTTSTLLVSLGTVLTHSVSGLTAGTTYGWSVRGRDNSGNLGTQSGVAYVTVPLPDTTAPTQPQNVTATPGAAGQITLQWTVPTDAGGSGLAGQTIRRCTPSVCTPTTTLTTVGASTASYIDTNVSPGTGYSYTVNGFDGAGNQGAFSAVASATTTATYRSTLATDTFTIANINPMTSPWTGGYTGANNLQVISNKIAGTSTVTDNVMTYSGITTPNDQHITATLNPLTSPGSQAYPGVLFRWANAPTFSGYDCRVIGPTTTRILKWIAGSDTLLGLGTNVSWQPGDKIRGEAQGTTLRCYHIRNGVETLVISTTDATHATGKTGLISYTPTSVTNASMDDVVIGGFAATVDIPPTITTLTLDATGATITTGPTMPTQVRVATSSSSSLVKPFRLFVPTFTQTISDDFADLASWTTNTGSNSLTVTGGIVRVTNLNTVAGNTHNTAIGNDQYAQVTIPAFAGSSNQYADVTLRWDKVARSGYACGVGRNAVNGDHIFINKTTAGVNLNLTFIETDVAAGDTFLCYVIGRTIVLSLNGVPRISVIDEANTYPSGSVGLVAYVASGSVSDITMDTFRAGTAAAPYRYTETWAAGIQTVCFHPIDSAGVENTAVNAYMCAPLGTIVPPTDQAPVVMSNARPIASLPTGTTSATASFLIDKQALCLWDTTDKTFSAMDAINNRMTMTNLTASVLVSGLTNGSTTTLFGRCKFTNSLDEEFVNTSSIVMTIHVLPAPASDTTAPTVPTDLVATALGQSQVSLVFTGSTDDVAVDHYEIHNATEDCATYMLAQESDTATTILVALFPNTVNCFKIRAVDTSNNLSTFSNIATITTTGFVDVTPPSQMVNLHVSLDGAPSLNWNQGTDERAGVRTSIEMCTGVGCTTFTELSNDVALNTLTPALLPSTFYRFRGRHIDLTGNVGLYGEITEFLTDANGQIRLAGCPCRNPHNARN